jgi:hypothetical protein
MDMGDFISGTGAGHLILSFLDWGYRSSRAPQAGTKRRLARGAAESKARAALYTNTPDASPSRQVIRAQARAEAKRERSLAKVQARRARQKSKHAPEKRAA